MEYVKDVFEVKDMTLLLVDCKIVQIQVNSVTRNQIYGSPLLLSQVSYRCQSVTVIECRSLTLDCVSISHGQW